MTEAGGRAPRPRRWPHPALLALLLIVAVYEAVATMRRMGRPAGRWVGYTECAWRGAPRIVIQPRLRTTDSIAVVAHESVHAAQCDSLGPVRYRWNTLFAKSNLGLETPAYCAGGRARVKLNGDTAFNRMTIPIDMIAAMGDGIDSIDIARAIDAQCSEFSAKRTPSF